MTQPLRVTKMRYRAPDATEWSVLDLDAAMEMVADRVWEARRKDWIEKDADGNPVNHTGNIGHLGGATLDEENYLIKKLFTGGLGMVCVSNQARI